MFGFVYNVGYNKNEGSPALQPLNNRTMEKYIEQNPQIFKGKTIMKETGVGVDLILEKLGVGETISDLLEAYSQLTKEAILGCVTYGAASVRNETLLTVD